MNTHPLPNTDLKPSVLCLGAGGFGSEIDLTRSFEMLDAFYDRGGNFLDSALIYADWTPYGKGSSERAIGQWMKARRNRQNMVVSTKGAHPELKTMHIQRLARQEILSDIEQSLKNLQTEPIDLYWLHRDDPARPAGEIIETLNEAARAGKIRYFGCSNWWSGRIAEANEYASAHGLAGFVADQMLWNMAKIDFADVPDQTLAMMDSPLYEYHRSTGMAAVPYSSQANGLFSKMERGAYSELDDFHQQMYRHPGNQGRFERARRLAKELSMSMTQVVLGYLLSQPFATYPIIGPKRMDQLLDSLSAAEARLTAEQIRFIEGERG